MSRKLGVQDLREEQITLSQTEAAACPICRGHCNEFMLSRVEGGDFNAFQFECEACGRFRATGLRIAMLKKDPEPFEIETLRASIEENRNLFRYQEVPWLL